MQAMLRFLTRRVLLARSQPFLVHPAVWAGRGLLGASAFGVAYHSSITSTIHADNPESDEFMSVPEAVLQTRLWTPAESYFRLCSFSTPSPSEGVARFDSTALTSNSDCQSASATFEPWFLAEILEGHNGNGTATFVTQSLPLALGNGIRHVFVRPQALDPETVEEHTELGAVPERPSESAINHAIKQAFMDLDHSLVVQPITHLVSSTDAKGSKCLATRALVFSYPGSSALAALYDPVTQLLHVACVGDSRAVLGRRVKGAHANDKALYEVHVLSKEHNARNAAEVARVQALFPGKDIVQNDRVLGMKVTRAFGDGPQKWTRKMQQFLYDQRIGDSPSVDRPWMTAEPEITTMKVEPGDFLILGSSGLWDSLTNEEAVGLMGLWLTKNSLKDVLPPPPEAPSDGNFKQDAWPPREPSAPAIEREELPVNLTEDTTIMYKRWRVTKRFLNVDPNAAVHLARNAMGGADRDLTEALFSMMPPRSLMHRKDVAVNVTFFH